MLDLYGSPAMDFFNNYSVNLSGTRTYDPKTRNVESDALTLYIDFHLEDKAILVSILSDATSGYEFTASSDNFDAFEAVVRKISTEYPGKVNKKNLADARVFYAVAPGTLSVESELSEEKYDCEVCGLERNDFAFLLVPAAPGTRLSEASLNLRWEFGCTGGDGVNGVFSEVKDDAREILARMLETSDNVYKPQVQKAIDYLAAFTG